MTRPSFDVNCRPAALVGGGAVSDTSRVVESTLYWFILYCKFCMHGICIEMRYYIEIPQTLYCNGLT